jgi:lambda repressor-like predicted transcriptional regulator
MKSQQKRNLIDTYKKPESMHPADIKAALEKNNITQRIIANELGVSESIVNNVVAGRSSSRRVAEMVAQSTGLSIEKMWPGRYPTISENDAA